MIMKECVMESYDYKNTLQQKGHIWSQAWYRETSKAEQL